MLSRDSSELRIIVTGGRDYADRDRVRSALTPGTPVGHQTATIVHGGARGADRLAAEEGAKLGYEIEEHPADWDRWGKRAGWLRNEEMACLGADLCIAFPGGRGTASMLRCAAAHGIPVRRIT